MDPFCLVCGEGESCSDYLKVGEIWSYDRKSDLLF